MAHPKEAGIAAEELATRIRRSKFYDRLDAPNTNIKYNIIDFEDPSYRSLAQHRMFMFKPEVQCSQAAHTFMTDEGGYQLGSQATGMCTGLRDAHFGFYLGLDICGDRFIHKYSFPSCHHSRCQTVAQHIYRCSCHIHNSVHTKNQRNA